MSQYRIDSSQLDKILKKYELGNLISIEEIETGLINPAYLVNNNLILRLDLEKYQIIGKFKREAILYKILPQFNIPTPDLIAHDDSKELIDVPYILMHYIPGENLLQAFKNLDQIQQKEISFQVGQLARQIHSIKSKDIGHEDLFKNIIKWLAWTMNDFESQWKIVSKTDYLSKVEKDGIVLTFEKFKQIPLLDKGVLTHGDFSAGNIQINNEKIVGVFDFEFAFIADPLWDLQKLPISFQLGNDFDQKEFLRGYGKEAFTNEEKLRFKMYCYMQGVWEIWATITQHMPFTNKHIQEGVELIRNTMEIDI